MNEIELSTSAAPYPERTIQLAETLAEVVRTLNHQTHHHEALEYPAEADRVIRALSSMAGRLPQLLDQLSAWLGVEQIHGQIRVAGGEWEGNPEAAVTAARARLDVAASAAQALQADLAFAAAVTCNLAAVETGEDEQR